jgi:hypothetical protein
MKKSGIALMIGLMVALFYSFAGAASVTLSPDGKTMSFPDREGTLPIDLSQIKFELSKVSPEWQPFVGKVFRGHFGHQSPEIGRDRGIVQYVILMRAEDPSKPKLFVSSGTSRILPTPRQYIVACTQREQKNEYDCATGNWNRRLMRRVDTFSLDSADGWDANFTQVATVPPQFLAPRTAVPEPKPSSGEQVSPPGSAAVPVEQPAK